MSLSKEEQIEIILLTGGPWCPYRGCFVNKEIIFPLYTDFWNISPCKGAFESPCIHF